MKAIRITIAGLICVLILTCAPLQAEQGNDQQEQAVQVDDSNPLFVIVKDGKFGFIDQTGKMVIEPQFSSAMPFSEGLAAVRICRKWGYIDDAGSVVIKPRFDSADSFSEGLAAVIIGDWATGEREYIDQTGEVVIKHQFSIGFPFSEGLAKVRIGDDVTGMWGFIDKTGEVVIEPQFNWAESFSEGLALVKIGDPQTGKWGFIDKKGKVAIDPQYDRAYSFSDGLALVCINNMQTGKVEGAGAIRRIVLDKWGFIDTTGKMVIEQQFYYASPFSEGLSAVKVGDWATGKYGYINKAGEVVIEPQFADAAPFSEGLAMVMPNIDVNPERRVCYIDTAGKTVIELPGFITGEPFSNGLAKVYPIPGVLFSPLEPEDWGYIDKTGKYVWGPDLGVLYNDLQLEPGKNDQS